MTIQRGRGPDVEKAAIRGDHRSVTRPAIRRRARRADPERRPHRPAARGAARGTRALARPQPEHAAAVARRRPARRSIRRARAGTSRTTVAAACTPRAPAARGGRRCAAGCGGGAGRAGAPAARRPGARLRRRGAAGADPPPRRRTRPARGAPRASSIRADGSTLPAAVGGAVLDVVRRRAGDRERAGVRRHRCRRRRGAPSAPRRSPWRRRPRRGARDGAVAVAPRARGSSRARCASGAPHGSGPVTSIPSKPDRRAETSPAPRRPRAAGPSRRPGTADRPPPSPCRPRSAAR